MDNDRKSNNKFLPKLLIKRLDQFLQTPKAKGMGMSGKSELLRHVLNQFLEEQEVFYNQLDYVSDFILEMKDGDHIVFTRGHQQKCEVNIPHGCTLLFTISGKLKLNEAPLPSALFSAHILPPCSPTILLEM